MGSAPPAALIHHAAHPLHRTCANDCPSTGWVGVGTKQHRLCTWAPAVHALSTLLGCTTSTWSVMGASGHLCHPVPWRPRSCTSRAASNMSAPSRTPHRGWMPRTRGRSGAGRRGKSESTAVVEAVHLSWLAFTHRFLLCRRARTAVHRHASRRCIRSCTAATVPRQLTTSHNHAPARVPRDRIEAIPENIITAPDSKDPLSVLGQPSLRPRVHAATVG